MKRIGHFVFAMVMFCFLGGVGSASAAAAFCFKDTQYTNNLGIDVVAGVLVGKTSATTGSPVTGTVSAGTAFFSIAYVNNGGLRFYQVNISTLTGTTWGASNTLPGTLYDNPHSATFVTCTPFDSADAGDSGAESQ